MDETPPVGSPNKLGHIVSAAACVGLAAGLVEGIALLTFQQLGWLGWSISKVGVSREIIWVSPLFDFVLFVALGAGLAFAGWVFPRLPLTRASVFVLSLLALLDWLLISGRMRGLACLILAIGLATAFTRWVSKRPGEMLRFLHRSLPWVAVTAGFVFGCIEGGSWLQERLAVAKLPPAPAGSPNILVIVVDTLRADHLSIYGYGRPTSPNIDRVAQQGVLFENAFATSSWTLPSHASMLTGRYPYEHGAERTQYDGRYTTLAEALQARGYRTAAISASTIWFSRRRGFGRGFIHFEDYFHSAADMAARTLYGRKIAAMIMPELGYEDHPGRKRAPHVTRAFLRLLDRDPGKRFFAFLNYFDAHDPYLPPQPYRSRFSKHKAPGGRLNALHARYYPELTPEQLQEEMNAYDGAIAYVDYHIGELLAALEKRGLASNTVVVITSDHGEAFGEHGLLLHINALYREVVRVPLIFWWPGRVPAGLRVTQPVSIAALPATIMELLGVTDQTLFPGPSLAKLWQDTWAHSDWPYPLAELAQFRYEPVKKNPAYHGAMKSLVSPQWHYIVHERLSNELYDWARDPQELDNLASTAEGQRVIADFTLRLQHMVARGQKTRLQSPPGTLP